MVYIPQAVIWVDVYSVVYDYLRLRQPIYSGSFLLAAPMAAGGDKFHIGPYGNFGTALKSAISRVHPEMDIMQFGASSPRKSMARWLYAARVPRHIIAGIGGWTA